MAGHLTTKPLSRTLKKKKLTKRSIGSGRKKKKKSRLKRISGGIYS